MKKPDYPNLPKAYKFDLEKLSKTPIGEFAYFFTNTYVQENFEYFDKIKHLLDIPEERKSLDEIQTEFNNKIDSLIEKTKRNFYASRLTSENNFHRNFETIIDRFEFAKKYGYFNHLPGIAYVNPGKASFIKVNNFNSINIETGPLSKWTCHFFRNKSGKSAISIKLEKEMVPNIIVRWFSKVFLGCTWIKTVDT